MKVELKLKQDIQVYDLVTTFAVSAPAPGLQRLCTFAQDRGGRIQSSDLEEEFGLKPGAARNLYQNGIMTEVWNAEGELTENGRHTIQTGEVMVKEVGAIRAWVFEHQATGPVLLHADRIDRLPKGDAEPQQSTGRASSTISPAMRLRRVCSRQALTANDGPCTAKIRRIGTRGHRLRRQDHGRTFRSGP